MVSEGALTSLVCGLSPTSEQGSTHAKRTLSHGSQETTVSPKPGSSNRALARVGDGITSDLGGCRPPVLGRRAAGCPCAPAREEGGHPSVHRLVRLGGAVAAEPVPHTLRPAAAGPSKHRGARGRVRHRQHRRGAGGHTRRRYVEVRVAAPAAADTSSRRRRPHPPPPCRGAGARPAAASLSLWPEGRACLAPWLGHQVLDEMPVSLLWW
jgi:hypothetical protein